MQETKTLWRCCHQTLLMLAASKPLRHWEWWGKTTDSQKATPKAPRQAPIRHGCYCCCCCRLLWQIFDRQISTHIRSSSFTPKVDPGAADPCSRPRTIVIIVRCTKDRSHTLLSVTLDRWEGAKEINYIIHTMHPDSSIGRCSQRSLEPAYRPDRTQSRRDSRVFRSRPPPLIDSALIVDALPLPVLSPLLGRPRSVLWRAKRWRRWLRLSVQCINDHRRDLSEQPSHEDC